MAEPARKLRQQLVAVRRPFSIRISTGVFTTYVLIVVSGMILFAQWMLDDLRPTYVRLLEENLVDTSRFLAALVGDDLAAPEGSGDTGSALARVYEEPFQATIFEHTKTSVDAFVYVTDQRGRVLLHTRDAGQVGRDYSRWNDVYLTLRGEYGVRSTRSDPADAGTTVFHVAAPIVVDDDIVGVLTVAKPVTWASIFINEARARIIDGAIVVGAASLLLAGLVTAWLTRPIRRLTAFSKAVADGQKVTLPRLGEVEEIRTMALAVEEMREALEGKRYIESYVQTLTHELKAPIAAIKGAAELLAEDPPPARREKFLHNIASESDRLNRYVEQMLRLSSVELQRDLREITTFRLSDLIERVLEETSPTQRAKEQLIHPTVEPGLEAEGEHFLVAQALVNLLQNAIDFTPAGGTIQVHARAVEEWVEVLVDDSGPGMPAYAAERVFDRFYSLPRPDSGKKSSGLGLTFVRQIAELHDGSVAVANRPEGGCRASFRLPRSQ